MINHRFLGNSGLKISEITYGNWLTHGSQVEADVATACVREALDLGITTFDTADVYANGKAEIVLGEALKGERREGLEIFTKTYWPVGENGPNDSGLSRKHIMEMPQLAIAWVLQNPNVSAAIVGASRPGQLAENVRAAGVQIPVEVMDKITATLGDAVTSDPALTADRSPKERLT